MKSLASRKIQEERARIVQSSSDNKEDTSSGKDTRWETRGDNSEDEVKENSAYKP